MGVGVEINVGEWGREFGQMRMRAKWGGGFNSSRFRLRVVRE